MKQHCSGDKLCSKSKLFLIRALSVCKDSGECGIIGPGSDTRQVVSKVHGKMESINPCFFFLLQQKGTVSIKNKLITYGGKSSKKINEKMICTWCYNT